MKMKKNRYIGIMLIIFLCLAMGCNNDKKEEDKKSENEDQKAPNSLEQLQQLSDEIVTSTLGSDWPGSLGKVKELQSTWNELYPDIQKKGIKKSEVDAFVSDLNILTDYLISKTLKLPPEAASKGQKSQEEGQKQEPSQGSESEQGGQEQGGQEQGGQEQGGQEQGGQEQGGQEGGQEQDQSSEEKKDPKKVLDEINPIISVAKEDLIIINASVEVTKHIPEFMSLYTSETPPDLYKLQYLIRHLDVAAKLESWDIVSEDFTSIEETWDAVKTKVMETDEDMKIKLEQSIGELKDVVHSKRINLIGVKSKLTLDNIESVIKKLKEKEKEKNKEKEKE